MPASPSASLRDRGHLGAFRLGDVLVSQPGLRLVPGGVKGPPNPPNPPLAAYQPPRHTGPRILMLHGAYWSALPDELAGENVELTVVSDLYALRRRLLSEPFDVVVVAPGVESESDGVALTRWVQDHWLQRSTGLPCGVVLLPLPDDTEYAVVSPWSGVAVRQLNQRPLAWVVSREAAQLARLRPPT